MDSTSHRPMPAQILQQVPTAAPTQPQHYHHHSPRQQEQADPASRPTQSHHTSPSFEDKYTIGEMIGKGAYAVVFKCRDNITKEIMAVKVIDKSRSAPVDVTDIHHEVTMMKAVGRHPFIVKLKEFFETQDHIYLVIELLEGGMLFNRIVQLKHYSEAEASQLIRNFLEALEHIHKNGIMHRDLKPENLLLRRTTSDNSEHLTDVALTDFGLASRIPGQTCCGSPSYVAPEVINVGYLRTSKEPYDGRCDVWSLGVITYILLSGKMPFHGKNFKETFARIVKGQYSFSGQFWDNVSSCAKDFIKSILVLNPHKRPQASEALMHPWVVNRQSQAHLPAQIENIRLFNAQQKVRAALMVFRATSALLGSLNQTPPFLKYLIHTDKLSSIIMAKSQTDPKKTHVVDYSRALLRDQKGWKMQDCCSCESKSVCRHIQNVHEYLFVGRIDMDVQPFINEIIAMQEDAECDLQVNPKDVVAKKKLHNVSKVIQVMNIFREEYLKVPQEMMKSNAMLMAPKENTGKMLLLKAMKKKYYI